MPRNLHAPRPPAPHIASTNFSKTNEAEDVIFLIPNLSTWKTTQVENSKSPAKLIKLFENSQFAKQFCITRENIKKKFVKCWYIFNKIIESRVYIYNLERTCFIANVMDN